MRSIDVMAHDTESTSPYNDGEPVAATLGNFLAMLAGATGIIAVGGGLYLEFAALAH